jgi:hypothetical protein
MLFVTSLLTNTVSIITSARALTRITALTLPTPLLKMMLMVLMRNSTMNSGGEKSRILLAKSGTGAMKMRCQSTKRAPTHSLTTGRTTKDTAESIIRPMMTLPRLPSL